MPYVKKRKVLKPRRKTGRKTMAAMRKKRIFRKVPRSLFPPRKSCTLVYKNPSVTLTTSGLNSFNRYNFALNDMYNFDRSAIVGNKQPLYFDQMLSGVGPYRTYKVNAWKTIITVQSLETSRSLQVYYQPGVYNTTTDTDNITEIQNFPDVLSSILCPIGSGKGKWTFKSYQTMNRYLGASRTDLSLHTAYNSSPSVNVYSTLALNAIDGSATSYSFQIQITHVFYCQLYDRDATVS